MSATMRRHDGVDMGPYSPHTESGLARCHLDIHSPIASVVDKTRNKLRMNHFVCTSVALV
jgi:hypothetical protein